MEDGKEKGEGSKRGNEGGWKMGGTREESREE